MPTPQESTSARLPASPWGLMPPRLRVLFVTGPRRTGRWLADAFAVDSAAEITLVEAQGIAAGAAQLREDVFDAVLISHETGQLNALDVIDALRAGSSDDQPILVLGEESEAQLAAVCYEAGADGYVCLVTATTRALIWQLARAHERHALLAENRRLRHEQSHRLQLEHDEAARLLQQQRALIADLEKLHVVADNELDHTSSSQKLPKDRARSYGSLDLAAGAALLTHYRELLRTYVIMGSGNLANEIRQLAEQFVNERFTGQQVMRLHLRALEEAVSGLGSRSARHVMNRADLLVLEVMLNLAEVYREKNITTAFHLELVTSPRHDQSAA